VGQREPAYLEALSQDAGLLHAATDHLVALNITAKKSALRDSLAQARMLLDAKNARELLTLLCHAGRAGLEKTVTYGCVLQPHDSAPDSGLATG
jgi:hypothetical protein